MFQSVTTHLRRCLVGSFAAVLCSTLVLSGSAAAQTVVLNQSGSQVTDTTIRSGAYANTNFDGQPLITRRSNDPDWERRTLLKFDTENFIPSGAQIASATLTLTVKSGLGSSGATRPLRALRVPTGFLEEDATWRIAHGLVHLVDPRRRCRRGGRRRPTRAMSPARGWSWISPPWSSGHPTASSTLATRACFSMTTRSDAKESYREYYSSEDSTVSRRPTLTIVLGRRFDAAAAAAAGTGSTLKVLQWNISQGYGQDGKSNIDRVVDFIVSQSPDVISFNEIMQRIRAAANRR